MIDVAFLRFANPTLTIEAPPFLDLPKRSARDRKIKALNTEQEVFQARIFLLIQRRDHPGPAPLNQRPQ